MAHLLDYLSDRVLLCDGAMGTQVQARNPLLLWLGGGLLGLAALILLMTLVSAVGARTPSK